MTIKFTAIMPSKFNYEAFKREFMKANKQTGEACKKDYEKITAGWKNKPKYSSRVNVKSSVISWGISASGKGAELLGYYIWGTRPHIIRPRRRKILHWVRNSKNMWAREVHHPGTKAHEEVIEELRDKYERDFYDNMTQALQRAVEQSNHKRR